MYEKIPGLLKLITAIAFGILFGTILHEATLRLTGW